MTFRADEPERMPLDRQGLLQALEDRLRAGAAVRRSRMASWAIAEREAELQLEICAIVRSLVARDDDERHGAAR